VVAACARIAAALAAEWTGPLLELAAFAWAGAFLGFAIVYGPLLWRRRKAAGGTRTMMAASPQALT
jgi:uncharacterized protein involved in response to NO